MPSTQESSRDIAWNSTASTLLGACALIASAHYLGATWLEQPLLGVPIGVWMIAVAVGIFRLDARRIARRVSGMPGAGEPHGGLWVTMGMACRACEAISRWLRPIRDRFEFFHGAGERCASRLSALHDRLPWPERSLRIGLAVGPEIAEALRGAPGSSDVRWVDLRVGTCAEGACRGLALDAVVQAEPGEGLRVVALERSGRDAAWHDWAEPRPLTYASAFPFLVDPSRASLGIREVAFGAEAELVRAMVECIAALSRSTHRIGLADRLIGRRPMDQSRRMRDGACRIDRAMLRLARVFEGAGERVDSSLAATCARGLSADLCAGSGRAWSTARIWELALRAAGSEPEVALREAAWRFVNLDDARGLEGIARADRALRARPTAHTIDHTVLLEWELEHGAGSEQAIGRLAAGICLACAGRDAHAIACVREDLLDDMRHSQWLVGRDQDRALLLEVFRHVERLRRTEELARVRAAA